MTSRCLLKNYVLCLKAPTKTLLFVAVLFVVLSLQLSKIKIQLNLFETVDKAFPSTVHLQELTAAFGSQNSLTLIVSRQDGQALNQENYCQAQTSIEAFLKGLTFVESYISPFQMRGVENHPDQVLYPYLVQNPCSAKAEDFDLKALKSSPWGNLFLSQDSEDLLFEISLQEKETPGIWGSFEPAYIDQFADFAKKFAQENPSLKIDLFSNAALKWHSIKAFLADSYGNVVILSLVVLLMRLFTGQWIFGFLFIFSLILTAVFMYGCMAMLGHPLTFLTNNLLTMICIAAIEDFVFIVWVRLKKGYRFETAAKHVLIPGFFTSLTTVIGFSSLAISDVQMIQHFGLWAAVGALCEFLVVFFVLPSLCKSFPKFFRKPSTNYFKGFQFSIPHKVTKYFYYAGLFVGVFGLFGFLNLNYDFNLIEDFPKSHPMRQTSQSFLKNHGWVYQLSLVFPEQQSEERLSHILDQVSKLPTVFAVESAPQIINWMTAGTDELRKSLIRRDVLSSPVFERYKSSLGPERALLQVKAVSTLDMTELKNQITSICGETICQVVGEPLAIAEFSSQVSNTLVGSFSMSVLEVGMVLVFLCLALGRTREVGRVIFASLWAPIALVGFLYLTQIEINFMTSVAVATIIGITGDNVVQFLLASRKKTLNQGIDSSAGATAIIFSISMCCSLVFLTFSLIPQRFLGLLLLLGFLFCWFGDVFMLKMLLRKKD